MCTDVILGICGIIGGLFTAAGDLLLDLKGKDNQKLGKYGIMDSAWDRMDVRRFKVSILLAMVGVPLIFLGMIAMARQMMENAPVFGKVFFYVSLTGITGGFFIHTIICLFPVIYKKVREKGSFEEAETLINEVYESIRIPFWIQYLLMVFVPAFMILYGLFAGVLQLSPWWGLATAPSLIFFSVLLNKIKNDWFCDLPFIISPSLSMSMIGFLAVLSAI